MVEGNTPKKPLVEDLGAKARKGKEKVVSKSLTLFHNLLLPFYIKTKKEGRREEVPQVYFYVEGFSGEYPSS